MEKYKRTVRCVIPAYTMQGFSLNSYNDMVKQSLVRSLVNSASDKLDIEIVEVREQYGCDVLYESSVYILTQKEMEEFKTQIIQEWCNVNITIGS